MKPGSKVVASHDIGSIKGKLASNPNLDSNLINKRMEEAEAQDNVVKTIPKELKGLEDLIFLGANTKEVKLGDFTFSISTLNAKEQEEIFKAAIKLPDEERLIFFKKGILCFSIKKINGKSLGAYLSEDSFEERLNIVMSMQQSVYDILFSEVEKLTDESSKLLTAENLKK
jgi:hypothetical protein